MSEIYHYRKQNLRVTPYSFKKNLVHWFFGFLILGVIGFGVKQATRSSLFILKTVVVEPLSSNYPLSRDSVLDLARVPVGHRSLFDLSLEPIEARVVKNPWVKGIVVGKQFPDTLSLRVVERTPVALLVEPSGRVLYLESDGSTFEDQAMVYPKELPIFSGFKPENVDLLKSLSQFMDTAFHSETFPGLKVSSLSYDEKLGLRAMIAYPMKNQKQMRTVLELGLNLEEAKAIPMARLKRVLDYISNRSQPASKIWLGDGKKIVVKFSRGS